MRPSTVPAPHPVVIGYNGSPTAQRALVYAAGVARRAGRPLLIVHVTSPDVYCALMAAQAGGPAQDTGPLEHWLLAEFGRAADADGLAVHASTRFGSPVRELAVTAAEHDADALVVGASRNFWRHPLGGLPARLTAQARCPVIVVP